MSTFLWPVGAYRFHALPRTAAASPGAVEAALIALFPGTGHAVAVSSGRAGLALALAAIGLTRPDLVEVPPYASHCVLDAVSRIATPLASGAQGVRAASVIYHQWGYVQARTLGTAEIIEDACDSLCRPGTALFPLRGRFELWSLPKILGCASGGVVWCRRGEDAQALRRLRDSRRAGSQMQFVLRLLGRRFPALLDYWAGREALCGYLIRPAAADVLDAFSRWSELAAEREARFAMFEPYLPAWLPRSNERLPCVVPIAYEPRLEAALHGVGIRIGRRHLERIHVDGSLELAPVLPVPIHQGASQPLLEQAAGVLEKYVISAPGGNPEHFAFTAPGSPPARG